MAAKNLLPEFPRLAGHRVIVVGDLMVDRYWYGQASRVSQEAPVPVVEVARIEDRPGGAANVALNLAALGAQCVLIGVAGQDTAAAEMIDKLTAAGVECDILQVAEFATLTKVRLISQQQQVMRADFEQIVPQAAAAQMAQRLAGHIKSAAAVVIEDYDKGTIVDPQTLIKTCGATPVIVDPKSKPCADFAGASIVKPNESELRQWLAPWPQESDLATALDALRLQHKIGAFVLTRGSEGMLIVDEEAEALQLPARRVDVFDVTGAGDTVAATLALGLAVGNGVRASARLANLAASIAVAQTGTRAVSAPQLRALLEREQRTDRGVLTNEQLLEFAQRARAAGERIVFTNGCFDILHAGHVAYLREARELGERLVVAINDDASVTRLKGQGRPVNNLNQRGQVLAALGAVDWVVAFTEDTPERLLRELQPDVLVKGGDYSISEVVGADIVQAYGGEIQVLALVAGVSTTGIVAAAGKVTGSGDSATD